MSEGRGLVAPRWRSTDRGNSFSEPWTPRDAKGGIFNCGEFKLWVVNSTGTLMMVCGGLGAAYRSTDNGGHWKICSSLVMAHCTVFYTPTAGELFATIGEEVTIAIKV